MTTYESRIRKQDNEYYALIVRIDSDGEENVIHGYARWLKTRKGAERSTMNYMKKHGMA